MEANFVLTPVLLKFCLNKPLHLQFESTGFLWFSPADKHPDEPEKYQIMASGPKFKNNLVFNYLFKNFGAYVLKWKKTAIVLVHLQFTP